MNATTTTTTETTPTAAKLPAFESAPCSRCGGSGEYSYCTMYGRVCFQCNGKKIVLTKRGLAASMFLRKLRERTAAEVKVGDKIKTALHGWARVVAITSEVREWSSSVNGVVTHHKARLLDIKTSKVTMSWVNPASVVEIALSAEENEVTRAAALRYQETLTKAGTPRKR